MPTIRESQNVSVKEEGISPRVRRRGFMPGLFVAEMEPRESGQSDRTLPQGEMILFETANRREQNFNINDENFVLEENKERPAKFFIDNVKKQYAAFGFVELDMLTPLDDGVAISAFHTVHPAFDVLGHKCPEGLDTCAHCRISLLEGAKFEGPQEELRFRLLQSYTAYHDYAAQRWPSIVGEREDRKSGRPGMSKFGEAEHHLRRNIHAIDPDLAAANAAKGFGDASAEGMKAIGGSIGDAVTQLAANQAAAEKRHEEQMAAMMQLIANQNASITTSVTDAEAKVDKRSREYRDAHPRTEE